MAGILSGFVGRLRRLWEYSGDTDAPESPITNRIDYAQLAALLQQVNAGDVESLLRLVDEASMKDLHLWAMLDKRRLALTGLDWAIKPLSAVDENVDENLATETADYVREQLTSMVVWRNSVRVRPFDECLKQMSHATAPNLAVLELVWSGPRVVDIVSIPHSRLIFCPRETQSLLFRTPNDNTGKPIPPDKFIVHTPKTSGTFPFENTLGQALMLTWLMKRLATHDWATYLEVFGHPFRLGKVPKNTSKADREVLLAALVEMGTLASGVINDDVNMEFVENSSRASEPFSTFIQRVEDKQTVAILGQTLTTQMPAGGPGSFAAAQVHQDVERSIIEADHAAERTTLSDQLFEPMVRMRWPMERRPIPVLCRDFGDPEDIQSNTIALTSAQAMKLPIEESEVYEKLNLKPPAMAEDGKTPINPLVKYPEVAPAAPFGGFSR